MLRTCSWNVNGGRNDVASYLEENIFPDFNIICLQELHDVMCPDIERYHIPENPNYLDKKIDTHLYGELVKIAGSDFHCYFAPQLEGLHDTSPCEGVLYGNALFVRKILPVVLYSSGMVYGQVNQPNTEAEGGAPAGKSGQVVTIQYKATSLTVGHFHGHWSIQGKVNTSKRMKQNQGVEHLFAPHVMLHGHQRRVLLLGDFNYTSKMQALQNLIHASMFGHTGKRVGGIHLNTKYGITDTRTPQYPKKEREADHAIASKALVGELSSCVVDPEVPSDHALFFVDIR